MTASAGAAPCVTAPVSTYTVGNFSCNVNEFTFSNMQVDFTTSGFPDPGTVILNDFSPITITSNGAVYTGLALSFDANAPGPNSSTDITWTYNVVGNLITGITSAYLEVQGSTTGIGLSQASEILTVVGTNIATLGLNIPGSTTRSFNPVSSLFVSTDQINFNNFIIPGTAESYLIVNAFRPTVAAVPGPILGGGIPGLICAVGGIFAWKRRRNHMYR